MFHGGIAERLVRFASAAVGAVRGGLGIVNVFSSMLFGGISGSAVADVSALGSILVPVMKEKGYDDDYAVNVTVTSSIAGIMIPPSHNMILYRRGGGGRHLHLVPLPGRCGARAFSCASASPRCGLCDRGAAGVSRQSDFRAGTALALSFAFALPGLFTAVIIVGGVLSGYLYGHGIRRLWQRSMPGLVTLIVYRSLTWDRFVTAVTRAVRDHIHGHDPGRLRGGLCLHALLSPGAGSGGGAGDRASRTIPSPSC